MLVNFFHFLHKKSKKQRNSAYINMNNFVQKGPLGGTESNIPLKAGSTRMGSSVQSGISPRMETPPPPREILCSV